MLDCVRSVNLEHRDLLQLSFEARRPPSSIRTQPCCITLYHKLTVPSPGLSPNLHQSTSLMASCRARINHHLIKVMLHQQQSKSQLLLYQLQRPPTSNKTSPFWPHRRAIMHSPRSIPDPYTRPQRSFLFSPISRMPSSADSHNHLQPYFFKGRLV